jgi:hypothetical protein
MEYAVLGDDKKSKEWAKIAKESLRIWSGVGHDYYNAMQRLLGETPDKKHKPYRRLWQKD